jgi:GrpB-like predicted nucleotidyltransferase (UPF0157 family)
MRWYPHIPYNPEYTDLFNREKERIKEVLGNVIIEHFGSTAVSGLGGKGYIDIYVVVDKKDLGKYSDLIQKKLGYEFKPNAGVVNERLFHQRKADNNIYHLHLTYIGNEGFVKDISFRDYLRKHPKDTKIYEDIKREASYRANKAKSKEKAKEVYMDTKRNTIQELLKKAHNHT